jgi:signal transduction histidine kinase
LNPVAASRRVGEWFASEHGSTLALDLGLLGALVAALATKEVVMWFHAIFVLLVVAALMLPLRQFAIRLVVWMAVTVALVTWAITSLDTPSEELTELPLLTLVLVLVFLVAQARARAARDARLAYEEIKRRGEVESQLLNRRLVEAQRRELIGRASTGLAHDLRNVFVVIDGCVDEIRQHADQVGSMDANELVDSCVKDLDAAAERGRAIIDDLLWLSRRHECETNVTDIGESMRQIHPFLRRMVRPGITLRLEVPEQPVFGRIDHIGLSHVLMNLVSNAVDAIEGVGHITVSTRQSVSVSTSGDVAAATSIVVSDDGVGFTEQAMAHVFEPDFTTKTGFHGGCGLATVRQIVDRCGGSVQIHSSPDSGTTIVLHFETIGTDANDEIVAAEVPSAIDFATELLSESNR